MSGFAIEHVMHTARVGAGAVTSVAFGPPSPGPLRMLVSARQAPEVPGSASTRVRRDLRGSTPPTSSTPVALVAPLAEGGHRPMRAAAHLAELVLPSVPAGSVGGGPILPTAFRIDILDASGTVQGTGTAPLEVEVAAPRFPSAGPALSGGSAPQWHVRITNTSRFDASITVNALFHGHRPVLSAAVDLETINRTVTNFMEQHDISLDIGIENRKVGERPRPGGAPLPIVHSFLTLLNADQWRPPLSLFLGQLGSEVSVNDIPFELDLGARIFPQETTGTATIRATIHDGAPALKLRFAFASFKGAIDLVEALRAVGVGAGGRLGAQVAVQLVPGLERSNSIRGLVIDTFFVLRGDGFFGRPIRRGLHLEVVTRARVELEQELASLLVAGALNVLMENVVPDAAMDKLSQLAHELLGHLLGEKADGIRVLGSSETLALHFVRPSRPSVMVSTA